MTSNSIADFEISLISRLNLVIEKFNFKIEYRNLVNLITKLEEHTDIKRE